MKIFLTIDQKSERNTKIQSCIAIYMSLIAELRDFTE